MTPSEIRFDSPSAAATEAFAARLAEGLSAGTRLLLAGPLGAGKTTLTRGLLRGLGHPDPREVASPTFALHHRYEGGRIPVDHLDLYRIEDAAAAARQGLLDPLHDESSIAVVEWWERLDHRPDNALELRLELWGEERRVIIGRADSGFEGWPETAEFIS